MKKHKTQTGKIIYIFGILLLSLVFVAFVLEKSQVTNLYNKPVSVQNEEALPPESTIDYSPANPTDNDEINQKKEDGSIDQSTNQTDLNSPISVILTAAGQDVSGGPVVIKVLLSDVTSGTCDIKLSNDKDVKNYSASVINSGTYYSCDGFEIPIDDLYAGSWDLTVTVTNSERSGSTTKNIIVSE